MKYQDKELLLLTAARDAPHIEARTSGFLLPLLYCLLFRPVSSYGEQRQCHIGTLGQVT